MTRMIRMKPRPKPRMENSGRCHPTSAEFWIICPPMTGNIRMIRRKPRPEPSMENQRSRNITTILVWIVGGPFLDKGHVFERCFSLNIRRKAEFHPNRPFHPKY